MKFIFKVNMTDEEIYATPPTTGHTVQAGCTKKCYLVIM